MNADRYEIEPRPAALGGGWRLRLFCLDPETGESIEVGGGVFPVAAGEDDKDAYRDAMETAQECMGPEPGVSPGPDEQQGMDWWNQLTEDERANWLQIAGSAVPAEAWAAYQRTRANDIER